jgi:hypothetical protein
MPKPESLLFQALLFLAAKQMIVNWKMMKLSLNLKFVSI